VDWKVRSVGQEGVSKRHVFNVSTADVVNVNVTSQLIDLYQTVKTNWTEDYYSREADFGPSRTSIEQISPSGLRRRRIPFVPFAICNETGLPLSFRTLSKAKESSHFDE